MVTIEKDENGYPSVVCDPEIASLVGALRSYGIKTVASCSGHGHRPGNIALADGRELVIAKDHDEARRIDALFKTDINGQERESTLEEQLHAAVSKWIARVAPKLREESYDFSSLEITIRQPQADDDGTLVLDWSFDEKSHFSSDVDMNGGGRVPGLRLWDEEDEARPSEPSGHRIGDRVGPEAAKLGAESAAAEAAASEIPGYKTRQPGGLAFEK